MVCRQISTFLSVYFNNTTRGYNKRKEKYCEQYTFPLGYIKNATKFTLSRNMKVFTVLFYMNNTTRGSIKEKKNTVTCIQSP